MLLYLLVVVVVALVGGLVPALAAAVAASLLLAYYFIPPDNFAVADLNDVVALVAFLLVAAAVSSVVGLAAGRAREAETLATASAASREELRRLAEEQAALRRVATLVAHGAPQAEVLSAVAQEVGRVLGADGTNILRLDPDGATTVVARVGAYLDEFPIGSRWTPQPPLALAAVLHTGHPARIDDFSQTSDAYAVAIHRLGIRSGGAAPIIVEGRLWGAIAVGTRRERFPADTEQRIADFTELVGTAIANAEGRAQLEDSRDEPRLLADEQAALRRVATLVAHGLPPAEVFSAVAQEVRYIVGADATTIARLDPDGAMTVLARVGDHSDNLALGSRWKPEPPLALAVALRTGRAARCDDYSHASGAFVDATVRRMGIRSSVATPIVVQGRLWGATVAGTRREHLPTDTEQRMAGFTELIGTAIANAEGRAQLEDSRDELRRLADEQAALRRVATLVAHGVRPDEIFAAVSDEVARLVGTDSATVMRYDDDGEGISYVGSASKVNAAFPVGVHWKFQEGMASFEVYRTGRSARSGAHLITVDSPIGDIHRRMGLISAVASPIVVEGRLWGAIAVQSQEPLPMDTDERLEKFTELLGTAIANADSKSELAASRRRVITAADDARRRIERDLHDGTQQRLVALGLALRMAQSTEQSNRSALQTEIGRVADELDEVHEELRELARGIHPAVLSEGGLGPALRGLARRAALPVDLNIQTETRAAERIEVAAYYVVSEALTNTTKHARASCARVTVEQRGALLHLSIRDDGIGGADPAGGSGLIGLRDRVQALSGSIEVNSPPGGGTAIVVELPLQPV
jgi:signal transduction histidine kinase/uncharacterized protein YoaH (UPF0181 family)